MLSERLEALIAALGMKNSEFAARIGFTGAYISMILSGTKTSPSPRFFHAIVREFHANADWLRGGAGGMFTSPDSDVPEADASLLAKYRLLPPAERKVVDAVVDAMLRKSLTEDKN